jgi:hypothetical protein
VIGVRRYDQSHDIDQSRKVRAGSGYTTGVVSSDRSWTYDRSQAYDQNCVFRLEAGIRPESRDTYIIIMYNG